MSSRWTRAFLMPVALMLVTACGGGGSAVLPHRESGAASAADATRQIRSNANTDLALVTDATLNLTLGGANGTITVDEKAGAPISFASSDAAIAKIVSPASSPYHFSDADHTLTLAVAPVAPGSAVITLSVKDEPVSVTVNVYDPTTVALTSSVNPAPAGESVTFSATAQDLAGAPVAGGAVTFTDGATVLCQNVTTDPSGLARCSTTALSTGTHTVTATLAAFGSYLASTGSLQQTIQSVPPSASCWPYGSTSQNAFPSGTTVNDGWYITCNFNAPNGDPYVTTYSAIAAMPFGVFANGSTHTGVTRNDIAAWSPDSLTITITDTVTNLSATFVVNWT